MHKYKKIYIIVFTIALFILMKNQKHTKYRKIWDCFYKLWYRHMLEQYKAIKNGNIIAGFRFF